MGEIWMPPLLPTVLRRPSVSLCGSLPVPSGGTRCHHLHLLRRRSWGGYLAVISHQATGRDDWHMESLRLSLLLALWVTEHPLSPPPPAPRLNPESCSKMFPLLFDLPSEFILEECTKILWILQECWTQWKSDVVKKANNMLKDVHCKWLGTSKRLMNLHFKKLAGGHISAYLISILFLYWVFPANDVSSFPSGQNTNIASPGVEMSGKGIVFLNQSSSKKFVFFINNRTQLLTLGEHLLCFRHCA